jgi:hypothetical protein
MNNSFRTLFTLHKCLQNIRFYVDVLLKQYFKNVTYQVVFCIQAIMFSLGILFFSILKDPTIVLCVKSLLVDESVSEMRAK